MRLLGAQSPIETNIRRSWCAVRCLTVRCLDTDVGSKNPVTVLTLCSILHELEDFCSGPSTTGLPIRFCKRLNWATVIGRTNWHDLSIDAEDIQHLAPPRSSWVRLVADMAGPESLAANIQTRTWHNAEMHLVVLLATK